MWSLASKVKLGLGNIVVLSRGEAWPGVEAGLRGLAWIGLRGPAEVLSGLH